MGNDYVIHSRKMFLHGTFGKSLQQSTNTKRNWIRKVPMILVEILEKCLLLKIDKGERLVQGLLDLDGRNSQKYLHQTWADF